MLNFEVSLKVFSKIFEMLHIMVEHKFDCIQRKLKHILKYISVMTLNVFEY